MSEKTSVPLLSSQNDEADMKPQFFITTVKAHDTLVRCYLPYSKSL